MIVQARAGSIIALLGSDVMYTFVAHLVVYKCFPNIYLLTCLQSLAGLVYN